MTCGIYKITNLVNQKSYIGQSRRIEVRWKEEQAASQNVNSVAYNYLLSRAFRKYGLDNFSFEIIEVCNKEELNDREKYWIKYYHSFGSDGYNQTPGGQGGASITTCKLTEKEVLEIRGLLITTSLSQKEIGQRYGVSINTISTINVGKSWFDDSLDYPLRKDILNIPKQKNFCQKCGVKIDNKAFYCWSCYKEELTKISARPSREQLKKEIRQFSFKELGRKYGITDNGIRRWCDSFHLPRTKKEILSYSDIEWDMI